MIVVPVVPNHHKLISLGVLTKRELEILQMILEQKSSKEISKISGTSLRTVENQRLSIRKKLDIHSTAGLTAFGLVSGLFIMHFDKQLHKSIAKSMTI